MNGKSEVKIQHVSEVGMWENQEYQIPWESLFCEDWDWRGRRTNGRLVAKFKYFMKRDKEH